MANAKKKRSNAEAKRLAAEQAARKARRQWAVIIGVGVLILGGFVLFTVLDAIPEDGDTSAAAWDLPARDNDPDGDGRITLAEFAGTPVVLNFYADWCSACEAELPGFAAVADELGDEVQFVHVNSREDGSWRRLVDKHGTDWWPIARDINGTRSGGSGLWETLDGRNMPITAFFDAEGRLVNTNSGTLSESQLRAELARLFGVV